MRWVYGPGSLISGQECDFKRALAVFVSNNYWDEDIKVHLNEFVLFSKAEYEELLKRTGFFIQETQRSIFDELNRGQR